MKISDWAQLTFLASLWGGSFLFMRIATPVLGPIWLMELRVILAALALLPLLIHQNQLKELPRYTWPLLMVGVFNSAIPFSLLAFMTLHTSAGFAAIVNATTPLFGVIVGFFWLQEALTWHRSVGFVLGFVGVAVLMGWPGITPTPMFYLGIGAGLLASLLYAMIATYSRKALGQAPVLVVVTGSQLGAALVMVPLLPLTVPTVPPTAAALLAMGALAIFSTAIAHLLYFRLINTIGPTQSLTVSYLVPLFAMLWSAIALHEPITPAMVSGCGLILLGTAIANGLFPSLRLGFKH